MDKNKLSWMQWHIRCAVQRLHKNYYKYPYIFITETDVQCFLYSELLKNISKIHKIPTFINDKTLKRVYLHTMKLHSEMYLPGKKKEFVDLCLIDPDKFYLSVQKNQIKKHSEFILIDGRYWDTEDVVGIEIKINLWYSNLKRLYSSLVKDFKKLKKYKRGWLIFVDDRCLIKDKKEWKNLVEKMIREANMGNLKKKLNAYYLCPKLKIALSYKGHEESF